MFIYQLKHFGQYREHVEDKEYVVVALNEKMAFELCRYADREHWSIRKLGCVTADVNDAVECGVIATVTR